jgi:hypothetical protein
MSVAIGDSGFGIGKNRHGPTVRVSCAYVNKQATGCTHNLPAGGFDESQIPNPESRGYTP